MTFAGSWTERQTRFCRRPRKRPRVVEYTTTAVAVVAGTPGPSQWPKPSLARRDLLHLCRSMPRRDRRPSRLEQKNVVHLGRRRQSLRRSTTSTRPRVLRRALPPRPKQHRGQDWWHPRYGRSLLLVPMEAARHSHIWYRFRCLRQGYSTSSQSGPRRLCHSPGCLSSATMPPLCSDLGAVGTDSCWFMWMVPARHLHTVSPEKWLRWAGQWLCALLSTEGTQRMLSGPC